MFRSARALLTTQKRSLELSVNHVVCYLIKTQHRGLINKPSEGETIAIDCYVDTDLSGLYGYEDVQDPSRVKRRIGYVICVGGVPVI